MYRIGLENYHIILASASRARQKLLAGLDIPFSVHPTRVEEIYPVHLKHQEITNYLSELKAMSFPLGENEIVIAADTIIWLEKKALEKPQTKKEAFTMLQNLSGKTHEVITSVCIRSLFRKEQFSDTSQVRFEYLTEEEIHYYIENYPTLEKAGAYGIQEWLGHIGISEIHGSHFNVMGLPVHKVYRTLIYFTNSAHKTPH
ncbi:MAG: Maf family nucleotide pyrophosphatase [Flavobacteriales bacterium AspAUS03]